jgi:hypothetical protein
VLAALIVMVIRWKWVIQKTIASADYPTMLPVPYIPVNIVLIGCAVSQFPWGVLIAKCW